MASEFFDIWGSDLGWLFGDALSGGSKDKTDQAAVSENSVADAIRQLGEIPPDQAGQESWYEKLSKALGVGANFLKDNPWLQETIRQGLFQLSTDKPRLDWDKLKQSQIDSSVMGSPDFYNQFGESLTAVDPKTGKRTNVAQMAPWLTGLVESMASKLTGPVNTYQAPESFDKMLGAYIASRENNLGIPNTGDQGFRIPFDNTVPKDVKFSVPSLPQYDDGTEEDDTGAPGVSGVDRGPDLILGYDNSGNQNTPTNRDTQTDQGGIGRNDEMNFPASVYPGTANQEFTAMMNRLISEKGVDFAVSMMAGAGGPLASLAAKGANKAGWFDPFKKAWADAYNQAQANRNTPEFAEAVRDGYYGGLGGPGGAGIGGGGGYSTGGSWGAGGYETGSYIKKDH